MKLFSKKPKGIAADDIAEVEYLYITTESFRGSIDLLTDGFPADKHEKIAHEYKMLTLVAKVFAIDNFDKINKNPEEKSALYDSFFKQMTAGATEIYGITTDEFHNQFRERLKIYDEAWSGRSRNPFEAIGQAFCHLVDCPSAILCFQVATRYMEFLTSTVSTLKDLKAKHGAIL